MKYVGRKDVSGEELNHNSSLKKPYIYWKQMNQTGGTNNETKPKRGSLNHFRDNVQHSKESIAFIINAFYHTIGQPEKAASSSGIASLIVQNPTLMDDFIRDECETHDQDIEHWNQWEYSEGVLIYRFDNFFRQHDLKNTRRLTDEALQEIYNGAELGETVDHFIKSHNANQDEWKGDFPRALRGGPVEKGADLFVKPPLRYSFLHPRQKSPVQNVPSGVFGMRPSHNQAMMKAGSERPYFVSDLSQRHGPNTRGGVQSNRREPEPPSHGQKRVELKEYLFSQCYPQRHCPPLSGKSSRVPMQPSHVVSDRVSGRGPKAGARSGRTLFSERPMRPSHSQTSASVS
eukprot:TRINITY_DN3470_c0_g2_i1.p1 TRINITY_DN3470_c0_g2~~TRINITY_DN3470_c0_g2_i1.p1  ORF type:complete len:345 (+),score=44.15 TRINITY_DN3470_c0_g2_i1:444-1478(+)